MQQADGKPKAFCPFVHFLQCQRCCLHLELVLLPPAALGGQAMGGCLLPFGSFSTGKHPRLLASVDLYCGLLHHWTYTRMLSMGKPRANTSIKSHPPCLGSASVTMLQQKTTQRFQWLPGGILPCWPWWEPSLEEKRPPAAPGREAKASLTALVLCGMNRVALGCSAGGRGFSARLLPGFLWV